MTMMSISPSCLKLSLEDRAVNALAKEGVDPLPIQKPLHVMSPGFALTQQSD